ncbi:tetratricopeptide repeat protein [Aliishimia ponticola]|uniref:Tetratricopeptide repeat protein 38 n=1 Tax=Aliishimia ponticola TaxID=2499833 RepID=A0A4S4NHU4_9RHOB|nr:tetratricopeptide repeat protein [Aliishimia ponticola]THH38257.1 tetratricopeptide repeat protein [Aliishimia ponticola]
MTLTDHYGNALSTGATAARDAYDWGVALLLAAGSGALEAFDSAIAADPDFALAHAGRARAFTTRAQMKDARAAIATAQSLAAKASAREQAHIAAMAAMIAGQSAEARRLTMAHVADHPRDALVAQLCSNVFGLIGFSGEVGREAELFAYTSRLLPHYGQDWWMMSMHALALCETGQTDASLALMEQALALNPRNANGAHFKAHALYELGEVTAGRRYLDDWMTGYDATGSLHGHLSWHSALWALADGDTDGLWQTVDARIGPRSTCSLPINVVTDTAAILYRAQMAGVAVAPERWSELSDYVAARFPNPGQSFVDIHAALAYAMAGEGEKLARLADTQTGFAADLVRPVARAWAAMAAQDWQGALAELTPVMGEAVRLGGSRAQRDLLELSYVNVLMKLGLTEEARRVITTRRPVIAGQIRAAA